jgi:hypothetical protein
MLTGSEIDSRFLPRWTASKGGSACSGVLNLSAACERVRIVSSEVAGVESSANAQDEDVPGVSAFRSSRSVMFLVF